MTLIGEIVGNELDKFCQNNTSITLNYIMVCEEDLSKTYIVKKGDYTLDNLKKVAINGLLGLDLYERPAAVIVQAIHRNLLIAIVAQLYLKISRARVYCCVILIF